ncbi:hypothetical protein [Desulforhabdus sp. TSK]|uniref:hypothetical protein n=1 Tax=Desulforhabdus sp. TSK TaxID=2925014 RepID=UPI001FC81245|nr:hypothetical protein [Desulforhabdus sp. TSK]GKT06954.1 hypothetical protein DSTSK_02590 [Desulforhabdus sp. TSK]
MNSDLSVFKDFLQQIFIFLFIVWNDYEMADHNRTIKYTSKEALLKGVKADLEARAAEEKARRERLEEERRKQEEAELKADPNFRELPKEILDRFLAIGITVRLNTTPFRGRGMKGEGGSFQRVFLQDRNAKAGALFRTKDTYLKPVLGATFESNWPEVHGAWWHMPIAKIDANGGFEKLASIFERNV